MSMEMDNPKKLKVSAGDRYRHAITGMLVLVNEVDAGGMVCFTAGNGRTTRLSPLLLKTFLRQFTRLPDHRT